MVNGIVGMGARAPQVVVVRENEKKKGNGTLAQVGNAAITAGGLYGTKKFVKAGANGLESVGWAVKAGPAKGFCSGGKVAIDTTSKFQEALAGVFNKMGDIMFKHPKMKGLLQRAEANLDLKGVHNLKGKIALVTTAGVTALALITRGIYKAGEIAGENK